MKCQQAEPLLTRYVDGPGDLSTREYASVGDHLRDCRSCADQLEEIRWIVTQLKAQPRPAAPADLATKLHLRLAAEGVPAKPGFWQALSGSGLKGFNWQSMAAGAAVAVAATVVILRVSQPAVDIQVASVPVDQNVGLQIAFDVGQDVKDVTFDIKLSDGLKFVDAKGQPVNTQEVQWKGELMHGKTVVPVTVRGVRPGKWEVLAVVRKDQLARETHIIVPVQGDKSGAGGGEG